MAYRSFSEFIDALEAAGELRRIAEPVATELEITALADREMKSPGGGKALLFEKPTIDGRVSKFPVAINTMGSKRRMALALKLNDVEELAQEMQLILKAKPPTNLRQGWDLLKQGINLLHARPKHVGSGTCQDVVQIFRDGEAASLTLADLPVLKCWPLDGGRFVTLPCVLTRDPDTGERNVGMYRIQIYDDRTTGMHWQLQKVGARHGRRYYETRHAHARRHFPRRRSRLHLRRHRAAARRPRRISARRFLPQKIRRTGEVRDQRPRSARQRGFRHRRLRGPGEPLREKARSATTPAITRCPTYPVFHVTAITHRKDAVYPATIVGIPPMEDFYIGRRVRETLPADLQDEFPGDRGHRAAGRRRLPQPRLREHPQEATRCRPTRSCTASGAWGR